MAAAGAERCHINNGGCWHSTQNGQTFSACPGTQDSGCKCPTGFKGDGVNNCEDINECKEKMACKCPECSCKNTWGSYECTCKDHLLYIRDHDTCISKKGEQGKMGWAVVWIILLCSTAFAVGGYAVYIYIIRSYMDSEIRSIMAQYMPLDNQGETVNHIHDETL